MVLDCGETWETKKARLSEWHPFFALWPRRVTVLNGRHKCAWLQMIERKGKYCTIEDTWLRMHIPDWWEWSYRLPSDGDNRA